MWLPAYGQGTPGTTWGHPARSFNTFNASWNSLGWQQGPRNLYSSHLITVCFFFWKPHRCWMVVPTIWSKFVSIEWWTFSILSCHSLKNGRTTAWKHFWIWSKFVSIEWWTFSIWSCHSLKNGRTTTWKHFWRMILKLPKKSKDIQR